MGGIPSLASNLDRLNPLEETSDSMQNIDPLLESIVAQYDLPAVACAVIVDGTLYTSGIAGVRKSATSVKAEPGDAFQIGSCAKAMTDTLLAILIEQGRLRWNSTLAELYPDLWETMQPVYRDVTVEHLMMHRAGMAADAVPSGKTLDDWYEIPGETRRVQRLNYVKQVLQIPPEFQPGDRFNYSNTGYIVLGSIAEQIVGRDWEDLMREMIFDPLDMESTGFGTVGTPGLVDAPWQHYYEGGQRIAVGPGEPFNDLPPVYGPAGRVHCSIDDWVKFIQIHINGEWEDQSLLRRDTILRLHQPKFGGDYAAGWGVRKPDWSPVAYLYHGGSNGMNLSKAWLLPQQRFAIIAVTNQAGDAAESAMQELVRTLMERYQPISSTSRWGELR